MKPAFSAAPAVVLLTSALLVSCLVPAPAPGRTIRSEQIEDVFLRNDRDDQTAGILTVQGGLRSCGAVRILAGHALVFEPTGAAHAIIGSASGVRFESGGHLSLQLGDHPGDSAFTIEDHAGSPLFRVDSAGHLGLYGDLTLGYGSALKQSAGFTRAFGVGHVLQGSPSFSTTNDYILPAAPNATVVFRIDLDAQSYGARPVFDQITVNGRTNTSAAHVTAISILVGDYLTGTHTAVFTNDTDHGNGTTGLFSAAVLTESLGPLDAFVYLALQTAGMAHATDIVLHSVLVDYHRE